MSSMKGRHALLAALLAAVLTSAARAEDMTVASPKIKTKAAAPAAKDTSSSDSSLTPDSDVIDAPTSAVLDDHAYSTRSRFYSQGGILEYLSFGVYPGVNLGASVALDGFIGNQKNVRVRAPNAQVKWRFYEGDQTYPSMALGYDGQGYQYNGPNENYDQRQRGFYVVATKELGVSGLQLHPSVNISNFNSNAIFGCIPLTYVIRDKVELMAEWDNIANWSDSRFNAGARFFVTQNFHIDFAVRAIGAGGNYSDGTPKGPERIIQLKYSSSF
jgi:opacity protein-like surface antigen